MNKIRFIGMSFMVLLALLLTIHFLRLSILTGASVTQLNENPQTQVISQNITNTSPKTSYKITNEQNLTPAWSLVTFRSTNADSGVYLLKKVNQNYTIALGPGNQFSANQLNNIPANIVYYLYTQGLVSGAETN